MRRRIIVSVLTVSVILNFMLLVACGGTADVATPTPLAAATAGAAQAKAQHWTYEGEEGPADWGKLDAAYALCSTGKQQSPIDLANPVNNDLADISFNYQPASFRLVNNGHTIQANLLKEGDGITLDGVEYKLAQFHFHAPSEHTLNSKHFPLELHFVHKSAEGKLAVVGVLLSEGKHNTALEAVWDNLPGLHDEGSVDLNKPLDVATMLPADHRTYRYDGSLTTPPCSEGVRWNVIAAPVEMDAAQLKTFTDIFANNSRPLQPLNSRPLVEDTVSR